MTNDTEPRALGAALSAPAFVTRGHGVAMHAANRHVERWAPEANAGRVGSMRSLGFVDRLVAPWMETAQRSASLRLFSQYAQASASQREASAVSWVFPRPWYQDELDWMAAARQSTSQAAVARPATPTLLTTRGTYVAPAVPPVSAPAMVMPSALYEYVAPSLSIAASQRPQIPGVGFGGETQIPSSRGEAYSPLVSLAAVQAADLMTRAVAPLAVQRRGPGATTAMTPGLRAVLTSILERAATPRAEEMRPTRLSLSAPELVTPPAPQPGERSAGELANEPMATTGASAASASASQVAEQYATQRTHIVELQRVAQQSAQRELAARAEALARAQADSSAAGSTAQSVTAISGTRTAASDATAAARAASQSEAIVEAVRVAAAARATQASQTAESTQAAERSQSAQAATTAQTAAAAHAADARAAAERAAAELRQRAGTAQVAEAQRQAEAANIAAAERARLEERIAQRVAQQTGAQRLHDQARAEAAAHARTPLEPDRRASLAAEAPAASYRAPDEVTAAIAGLPPELAVMLGSAIAQRPERAMQAINELNETLRTVELLARSSASGAAFEVTRGPRMMMPAGLGGLVNAIDRAQAITDRPAMLGGSRPLAPLAQFVDPQSQVSSGSSASSGRAVRMPALSWLSAAPRAQGIGPTTALGATATAAPAALSHVAWTDRWLARFAGAAPQSLDLITATAGAGPALRLQALANAAPGAVFVSPDFQRGDLAGDQSTYVSAQDRSGAPVSTFAGIGSTGASPAAEVTSPEEVGRALEIAASHAQALQAS